MSRVEFQLVLLSLLAPGVALSQEKKPAPPPWITLSVKPTAKAIELGGKTRLPNGTQLSAAVTFNGRPLHWRRAYVLGGQVRVRHSRQRLLPGHYVLLVRYEKREQLATLKRLIQQLAAFPAQLEAQASFRIGEPIAALRGRVAELALLSRAAEGVAEPLTQLETLLEDGRKAQQKRTYDGKQAIKNYSALLKKMQALAQPIKAYADTHAGGYAPDLFDLCRNVLDQTASRCRAEAMAELLRVKFKVPRAFVNSDSFSRNPAIARAYVARELPRLKKQLAKRLAQRRKALTALEATLNKEK